MGQESVRQEARRLALDMLVRRRERAKRERRLNGLAVERLTALGERDRAVRDTEPRAGVALPSDPLSRSLVRCHLQWAALRRQSAKFIQQSVDLGFGGGQ